MNELIAELRREILVRLRVYKNLIAMGKLSEREAVRRIWCFAEINRLLRDSVISARIERLLPTANPGTLKAQTADLETVAEELLGPQEPAHLTQLPLPE